MSPEEGAPSAASIVAELTRAAPVPSPPAAPKPPARRPGLARGERERLPTRRGHETHGITVGPFKIMVQIGTRPDGTVCELFVRMHKEGAPVRALMNGVARLVSGALQHGTPLAELARDLQAFEDGPELVVAGHETITSTTSLLAAIGQILETYPGGRKEGPPCG